MARRIEDYAIIADTEAAALVSRDGRYRGDTLILETEFETEDGTVRLVDFMAPFHGDKIARKDSYWKLGR